MRGIHIPQYTMGVQQVAPDGDYDFLVDDAGEKESSKGNPMIELQLLIEYNGTKIKVYDNLVFVQNAFWKIDQFRIATGEKLIEGQKINFEAEDCIDRKGRCHLVVDTYEGRTRNKIDAYLPPETPYLPPATNQNLAKPGAKGIQLSGSEEPDDIPFSPCRE